MVKLLKEFYQELPIIRELSHHRLEGGGFGSRLKARLGLACSGVVHPEVIVILGRLLRGDGFHDYLVGHVARTGHEGSPGPHVPPPARLVEVAVFPQQEP